MKDSEIEFGENESGSSPLTVIGFHLRFCYQFRQSMNKSCEFQLQDVDGCAYVPLLGRTE